MLAWGLYDWANSSFSSVIITFVYSSYFISSVAPSKTEGITAWGLALGLSGFIVAIFGPILGALADQSGRRKRWLAFFTLIVIISTALMWFVKPNPHYMILGLILIGVASNASEFSYIFYNAMLPELAGTKNIGRWSGWGWAMGYIGGMLCLILVLVFFVHPAGAESDAHSIRASFLLCAAWYIIFSLPIFLYTPTDHVKPFTTLKTLVFNALTQLSKSMREVKHYKNIYKFLIARMIFNDALITLFSFGGIYAAAQFNMSEQDILLFGITLNITAGIGAACFAFLDDVFGGRQIILLSLLGLIISGLLALWAGSEAQFWIYGMIVGIFVGPAQASSRSYLSRTILIEHRNQMFGFFALSAKVTSFLGPLAVSWVTWLSGNLRLGMSTIILFFLVGFFLMLTVNKDK